MLEDLSNDSLSLPTTRYYPLICGHLIDLMRSDLSPSVVVEHLKRLSRVIIIHDRTYPGRS